jgi:phage terminase small subunit
MANRPSPPNTLDEPGTTLWERIIGDLPEHWELDERELHLLESACHVRDQIASLDAAVAADGPFVVGTRGARQVHPGIAEARQLRGAEMRLLRALQLTNPADVSPTTRKAQKAAHARWDRVRAAGNL